MRTKLAGLTASMFLLIAGVASAAPVLEATDYTGVTTGITDELGVVAAPAFLLLGVIAGVLLAVRVFKKVTGAKSA